MDHDPFNAPGNRDIFHEQRMLQDKIDGRPERVTYEEEVARSSYQASQASSVEQKEVDLRDKDDKILQPQKQSSYLEDGLIELEDYDPSYDDD